ncbi:MAG: pyruvate kinase [Verrucomicrobiota bacterium]
MITPDSAASLELLEGNPPSDPEIRYRHTKIIFTIGPATAHEDILKQLILEQVDICRINMAHGSHEWTRSIIRLVKQTCQKVGRHIALLMDIKGPEIRTGDVGEPIYLQEGEFFDFWMSEAPSGQDETVRGVEVNYPNLIHDVSIGDRVLVDSGLIHFEVSSKGEEGRLRCKVLIPGCLGNRRHINLPGVRVGLPSLTDKDRVDIALGLEEGVDFFALSFAREASAVTELREHLMAHGSEARIIAKIEDQQAIANLDEIIEASDGVMVARGDLGIECAMEELPIIQHRIIKACIRKGRSVIVATHMLESMIQAPVPTRAEVSDISYAVLEKADAIMLSGETTTGKYPLECVRVFKRIARRMEMLHNTDPTRELDLPTPKDKMLRSAVYLANDIEDSGIVVFSKSGYLVRMLSALRPKAPIYAYTDKADLFRSLLIFWGVEPFLMEFSEDPEDTIRNAFEYLKRRHWVKEGQTMVVITNALAKDKVVDTLQIRTVR